MFVYYLPFIEHFPKCLIRFDFIADPDPNFLPQGSGSGPGRQSNEDPDTGQDNPLQKIGF